MSGDKPRAEIRDVTPEWAAQILARHDASLVNQTFRQRKISKNVVDMYARDMKSGNWGLTGQGITFDVDDNLLDGQHRLYAVCKAGVTIRMLVMWNVPTDVNSRIKTINTMDSGKRRDLAAQLKIEGLANVFNHASATRLLATLSSGNHRVTITPAQGIAIYSVMGKHIQSVTEILFHASSKSKYAGSVIAPLVLLRTFAKDEADLFATEFVEMTNLKNGSPVLAFSRYLDKGYVSARGNDAQQRIMQVLASALEAYVNETDVEDFRTGTKDSLIWLTKNAKNAIAKIREVAGMELTVEELRS